jgi:hypothetical protein
MGNAGAALKRSTGTPGTIQLDERRIAVISLRTEAFIDTVENVTAGPWRRRFCRPCTSIMRVLRK